MQQSLIDREGNELHYLVLGKGTQETFIAFHGFGRRGQDFKVFEPLLLPHQRIVTIDLYFHGESRLTEESQAVALPLDTWKNTLLQLQKELEIDRFSLLGYSLGGRIAMCTFELFPTQIDRILLFAPDGLKVNRFYDFITHARVGKAIYDYFDKRPDHFKKLVGSLQKGRLISKKLGRFALRHTEDEARRKLVRDVWQTFRNFFPEESHMNILLEENKTPFTIYFGEHDVIIKPELGDLAKQHWGEKVTIKSIPTGHSSVMLRVVEAGKLEKGIYAL